MSEDLGPFGWVFENGEFRGLAVGTKVVFTKSLYIGHVGRVVSLHSDGRVTYIFPTFSSCNETYSAEVSKSKWGIAVIPSHSSLTTKMLATEASKYYNPKKELFLEIEKIRKNVLLSFLQGYVYLVDIILDYENAIQLWFSSLGWVFENGKYLGLQKGTKVVCTKSGFIGYVGWVDKIHENDPAGKVTYIFPQYEGGRYPERYTAAVASRRFGICVVPDDTDLNTIMDADVARNYLRVRDYDFDKGRQAQLLKVSRSEWLGPLGWVFGNGRYTGLQKNTKVVSTKPPYIGYVGWVAEIHENCPAGTVAYYFPRYQGGQQPELCTANVAITTWGLCVVPDDTDVNTSMSAERARSYLRVRESG